jgi:hypothetical protein
MTKFNELIYVACPYSHLDLNVVNYRIKILTSFLAELASKNKIGVSPLLMHFCINEKNQLPSDYKFWQNYSLTLLNKCDSIIVLMLPGAIVSTGVKDEIDFALSHNKPVKLKFPLKSYE